MKKDVAKAKAALKAKPPTSPIPPEHWLSTGSTLLNLATSGRRTGGFFRGAYVLLVGDSASGKTFLSLTCLAEASLNKHFVDHRFIFDNAEDGALMDIERFFGKPVAERIEPPASDTDGNPVYSSTVEEFFYHVDDAQQDGRPFIYILDSMDALESDEDTAKFDERKKAYRKGTKATGSYGTAKPKLNSMYIRKVVGKLKKTGSILIVISQTRDAIGFGSQFEPKTRSGGRSLRFYAHLELWSSIAKKIKRTIKGQPRQLGIICKVAVKKNRVIGRERNVLIPIYWSMGIADVDSCVSWLLAEGHWKETKGVLTAPEFEFKGRTEEFIRMVEAEGRERELQILVSKVWQDIDAACMVERKRRYI